MNSETPLHAVIFGPKRHAEFRIVADGTELVDCTEVHLGGTYADPPEIVGRSASDKRAWSLVAVGREVAFRLARELDPDALRLNAPWDQPDNPAYPSIRRLSARTPEMAQRLPSALGPRPGTRYLQGLVDPMRRDMSPTPVALDPGGDLADWRDLAWVSRADGSPVRVTTDPMDHGAVLLETLDARAAHWSRPPSTAPIESVSVHPKLVRRVGRVSGVIDADVEGLEDLAERRPVFDHGDPAGFVRDEAMRLGPRSFARQFLIPLKTAERLALGGQPSLKTIEKVLAYQQRRDAGPRVCGLEECERKVPQLNARYCCPTHKNHAYRLRRKSQAERSAPESFADLPVCRVCDVVMLGMADRGGICRTCERLPS